MATDEFTLDRDAIVDERHALISSRRVEGTPVFNRQDGKLGTIHSLMIDKRTGVVAYALLAFGGFLWVEGRVHPIPWRLLRYDSGFDAYMLDIGYDEIRNAPSLRLDDAERPIPSDRIGHWPAVPG